MSIPDPTETRLRDIREAQIKEYEDAVHEFKQRRARLGEVATAREQQRQGFLRSLGATANDEEQQRKDAEELMTYLDEVRPALVTRQSSQAHEHEEQSAHAALLSASGALVLRPHAAAVMALDASTIANIPGERGNPWVFPSNPGQLKVKFTQRGSGSGCGWAGGIVPTAYNVYFSFTPTQTATYGLTAIFVFHGFYILKADDGWFSCKNAGFELKAQVKVHQYADLPWKPFPLISDRGDNINQVTNYDATKYLDYYNTVLKAGDPVIVTAQILMDAYANGSGSYSELNFEAGTANYMQPLLLTVAPI